jgi:hypothetical protein
VSPTETARLPPGQAVIGVGWNTLCSPSAHCSTCSGVIVVPSGRVAPAKIRSEGSPSRMSRVPSSKPRASRPCTSANGTSVKVDSVSKESEPTARSVNSPGYLRVEICDDPPAKSAGMSGVADLTIWKLSSRFVGRMSSGTTRRSGSGLGSGVPLNSVLP